MKRFVYGLLLMSVVFYPKDVFAIHHEGQMISADQMWGVADSPHYINGDMYITSGTSLGVESGAVIVLNNYSTLTIDGTIHSNGTIYIRSDDGTGSVFFNNNGDGVKEISHIDLKNIQTVFTGNTFMVSDLASRESVVGLRFENKQLIASGLFVASSSMAGVQILSDSFSISSSTIVGNALGIDIIKKRAYQVCNLTCSAHRMIAKVFLPARADITRVIIQSKIVGNTVSLRNKRSEIVDARHNWWGGVPVTSGQNSIVGEVIYDPWNDEMACCSNILFLPGMQASRLVERGKSKNTKRWEPGGNSDIQKLLLRTDGSSVGNIFAPAPIDAIRFWNYKNAVYEQFLIDLQKYKKQGSITEYRAYGYDWRLDPEMYIDDIVSEVVRLASSSKTGGVSIVGHSMGGLIGRLVIRALDEQGRAPLVDRMVFVGTPHVGAPQAYGALLHGDGQEYVGGLIMSSTNGRALARNMVSAHMLLPAVQHISALKAFIDCGTTVICSGILQDKDAIESFLTAQRSVLTVRDPESLLETTLSRARDLQTQIYEKRGMHKITATNIVGNGVSTSHGLHYEESVKQSCARGGGGGACVVSRVLEHSHIRENDGDGTVPALSATGDISNANTIMIDLPTISAEEKSVIVHYNMLESSKVRSILFDSLGLKALP